MAIQDTDVQWVEEPRMGLWEATFLPAIIEGLKTTAKHIIKKEPITQQFPEEKPDLPLNYRGVHRLNRDDQGRVKCVACYMCATACPARCIDIDADEAPWPDRDKYPTKFVIDELKCIYCGMCEEACPVDAIELTSLYDIAGHTREQMLFDKEKLLSIYDETKDSAKDPVRTHRGELGMASDIERAPLNPPTPVKNFNNAADPQPPDAAVISRTNPDTLNAKKD
ncbi:MAG: NuoI/complex I 23 kDa subunit family protein [Planctomycetaceae bacterium]